MTDIKNLLKDVQEDILLAPYTTFKIGGPAKYFYAAKTVAEIKQAAQVAKELELPYYIIGNGSNILVSDQGFDGLVIKVQNKECNIDVKNKVIKAGAGIGLNVLVRKSIDAGLTGLEWMIGIPGTLGGAIYSNAGAFGHSISENIESVEVLNDEKKSQEVLAARDCQFGYRTSVFKSTNEHLLSKKESKFIILSAMLRLGVGNKKESEDLIKDYLAKRNKNQPIGSFNAGSIFKNPLISENQKVFERIARKYFEVEEFRANGKIPAGWLIEEYGLKGKKIGGAMISEKHGNVIINTGTAKAEDVIMLISLIKQKIRVNFGIQLEEEIQYVGF